MTSLTLVSARSAATTYSFETRDSEFRSWALCTVNDATGELLITSDWGSWSYRWDATPASLGAPTLTAFIGDRGDVDYLARKLQREGRAGRVFSAEATARALRRRLCERRRSDGRAQLEGRLESDDMVDGRVPGWLRDRYEDDGLPIWGDGWQAGGKLPFLTRSTARHLWRKLGDLASDLGGSDSASGLFWLRLQDIDGVHDYVSEEPWQYTEMVQTSEDRALRDIILPALIAACQDTVSARARASTPPSSPASHP